MGVQVSPERFEDLVAEALDLIPPDLSRYMENVAVVVQDWPSAAQQDSHRGVLLGLYEGVSLTNRGPLSYSGVMPDRITIFREPHCRLAHDEEQLRHRIAITIVHEIAHHFGLSDARLAELGWA